MARAVWCSFGELIRLNHGVGGDSLDDCIYAFNFGLPQTRRGIVDFKVFLSERSREKR